MTLNKLKSVIFGIVVASILFTVGCNKLSINKYNKLKIGMSYSEVTALLGKPNECDGAIGLKKCTWGDETKNINVSFAGDKVLVFSCHGL